jgi:hypothetical protein
MNNQIGFGVFGTFGDPYGYQQVFYNGVDFNATLDLDESEIEFYPGTDLYAVRREMVDGVYTICFCVYTYERELNTERFGTFLGSAVVLQDGFTEPEYIYRTLLSFHWGMIGNEANVSNNTLKVLQAKDMVVKEPSEFVAAKANFIPISKTPFFSSGVNQAKKLMILPDPMSTSDKEQQVIAFFEEALKHFSDCGSMYFSFDRNVHEFAIKEAKVSIMGWDAMQLQKSLSAPATVVRTKKGITKMAAPSAATHEPIQAAVIHTPPAPPLHIPAEDERFAPPPPPPAKVITDEKGSMYLVDDDGKDDGGREDDKYTDDEGNYDDEYGDDDRNNPFDLWEETVPANGWTKDEIEYRVKEYNRLFKYTNSLMEHLNVTDEETVKPKKTGSTKKKRTMMLLAVVGGIILVAVLVSVFSDDGGQEKPSDGVAAITITGPVNAPTEAPAAAKTSPKEKKTTPKTATTSKQPAIAKAPTGQPAAAKTAPASQPKPQPTTTVATTKPAPVKPIGPPPAEDPKPAAVTTNTLAAVSLAAVAAKQSAAKEMPLYHKAKELHPKPNLELTQNDIPVLRQVNIKDKTLSDLTRVLFESVPSNIGNIYREQELQYAAALLNSNRQAFKKSGNDYVVTAEYHVLHIPAYKSPRLPAVFPK